ncbi:MAG: CHRD domain-containing protein, partial [Chitinophagales bacterium]
VNLHTDLNPNGEIRGQVYRFAREGYTFEINGSQEVPMVSTAASGFGITTIDRDQSNAHFMIVFSGLSATATGAHFHKGVAGVNGDVIFDITPYLTLSDNQDAAFGYWKSSDATPFTVANSVQFRNDSVYFNVHTDANPNGEIRGDSKRGTTCFNISVGVNEVEAVNESLSIYPNPAANQLNVDAASVTDPVNFIAIYDLSGRLLQLEEGQKIFNNKLTMDITNLAPGMYLLSIETTNQKIMKPFTKQ